jgi:predicted permease
MRWWHQFLFRLERILHWREADQDLEEEIRSHIELETQDNIDRGVPPEQARRAAHIKFGSTALAKEDSRAVWGFVWAEQLWQDLRYGARILTKSPGFTATAVVSLALGIGATTAVFSVYETIFLRPLPFPEEDRLVGIWERQLDQPEPNSWAEVSSLTFLDWKKQSQSYEELAQTLSNSGVLDRSDRPEEIAFRFVSDGYFRMVGAEACQGRLFLAEDYTRGQTERGVLSYGAWQRLFGSDPSIVGKTIMVDGAPRQIVGVMRPEYREPWEDKVDLWLGVNWSTTREQRLWEVIGRLKPGISIEKAQAELDVIEAGLARQYPEQKGYGARIQQLQVYLYGDRKMMFLAFFAAVVLVLLIACTNVANLILARAATRETEMAVRASLGAARPRLVRQLLSESLLLSGLGAALGTGLGLLLAQGGVRLAARLSPDYVISRASDVSINLRVLGFAVVVSFLTGLFFGLFPALGVSKPDLNQSLKEAGHKVSDRRGTRGMREALVVIQIAFSLVLLIGAGLMTVNVWRILHASVGYNTKNLTQMAVQLSRSYFEAIEGSPFARMKPKTALTIQGIEERLRALPGVSGVSISGSGILWNCWRQPVSAEGPPRRDQESMACYEPVSPGYFQMLEIPVLKGRVFADSDSRNAPPVAIVSQRFAQQYFPGQDPVGKMINIGFWEGDDFERRQVVGVVGDVRWTMNRPLYSAVYYPYLQLPAKSYRQAMALQLYVSFLVRSAVDPANLAPSMERAVSEVANDVLIPAAWTADYTRWWRSQPTRLLTWLLSGFAGVALVLAAVGVYGVMSYVVSRRTHEIGIRMALGAHPGDVLRLIMQTGIRLTVIGLAIGLASGLGLVRFLQRRIPELVIYEVQPTDPPTLAAVCLVLALVALLACYIPARRAARMNPLTSLRYE